MWRKAGQGKRKGHGCGRLDRSFEQAEMGSQDGERRLRIVPIGYPPSAIGWVSHDGGCSRWCQVPGLELLAAEAKRWAGEVSGTLEGSRADGAACEPLEAEVEARSALGCPCSHHAEGPGGVSWTANAPWVALRSTLRSSHSIPRIPRISSAHHPLHTQLTAQTLALSPVRTAAGRRLSS